LKETLSWNTQYKIINVLMFF